MESVSFQQAYDSHLMCSEFAERYELPVDYVYMEFVDPTIATPEAVTQALDVGSLMVYS